uniref:C2 domain-containing protein n=1 Tax=Entomoneis paludosa TaxID=265537 RepID=A0A6U3CEQ1_9STRA|mmetsp:Transcript_34220/g.71212  ORF Transcript_34220/g.71212 Transcript_34220/m.71212 type:complete len:640 (+) Transcript_34220:184-2103(+)
MTSRLQLHLSARDLKNIAGLMGVSDPFCVITIRGDSENNQPQVIGQTDVVFNNLSPSWSNVIFLDGYRFGVPCYFEVGVFDFDAASTGKTELELSRMDVQQQSQFTLAASTTQMNGNHNHKSSSNKKSLTHKVMGTALFEVGQILGSRGNVASKSLQSGGVLTVHLEKCPDADQGTLHLQLQGHKCKGPSRSAPHAFYEMFRKVDRPMGAIWESVYRSNTVKSPQAGNLLWNAVDLNLQATCNGDLERAIKIVVWDHKRSGKHKYMGECETSIEGLVEIAEDNSHHHEDGDHAWGFELLRDGKAVGRLQVLHAKLDGDTLDVNPLTAVASALEEGAPLLESSKRSRGGSRPQQSPEQFARHPYTQKPLRPEFVDYLSGGCQISLAVAIDYSASNGDPRADGTPHYFYPPQSKEWNDYEKAIFAVGSILAKYDSDQRMPVWGFGAKYNDVVRHCFQCGQEVEVEGVQGIMDAYRGVFRTPLTMSFPTKLTEVIETAASYARHEQELAEEDSKLSYTILLILTSGNVEDVKATKQCLIDSSDDPLSVIIVGIGDGNFDSMAFLDDHDPTTEAGRDITKFVRFSEYQSFNALTEAVLDEIPQQLVDYYFSRNILPGQLEDYEAVEVKVADPDDDERTFTFLG